MIVSAKVLFISAEVVGAFLLKLWSFFGVVNVFDRAMVVSVKDVVVSTVLELSFVLKLLLPLFEL